MLTLDFLSLLLSKQNPTQASVTLSQQLRDMVGIGTMGADKLHESLVTPEKAKDNEDLATGWTLMEINKTRDAAEEASAFLHREIEAESKYWEEVIAVQKAGWSICKVPQERHTLGVRFGFSEGKPSHFVGS
jgi:mediator of RNA polymerase II transcription subunit 17